MVSFSLSKACADLYGSPCDACKKQRINSVKAGIKSVKTGIETIGQAISCALSELTSSHFERLKKDISSSTVDSCQVSFHFELKYRSVTVFLERTVRRTAAKPRICSG